jgi:F-type H+-transporting ATPase subunit gamma
MATLRDIRRRIRTVQKTQQITSAMRMVAAAKLRRAQDAILAARPYSQRMFWTLRELARRQQDAPHSMLEGRTRQGTLEILLVTSDRGLCGAFNNNCLKRAEQAIREHGADFQRVSLSLVGRKGADYFRRRRPDALSRVWVDRPPDYRLAVEIAEHVGGRFLDGAVDRVVVVATEFVSALTQTARSFQLLPFPPAEDTEGAPADADLPYEIEPDPRRVLDVLVPQALEFTVYRALLENAASEQAARMTAMESATRNTEELIRTLTLQFNRARQAAITKELVEIVSGAEAL